MLEYFTKLYNQKANDFYELVKNNLKNNKKMFIITANPETFTIAEEDSNFKSILLDEKNTLIPDGIGIVKSAKILKHKLKERITGIDLSIELLNICNEFSYKVALIGAQEEVIQKLQTVIKEKYPNIKIIKSANGFINDKDRFFEDLIPLEPDVCLVALGIPMQELLIAKHISRFNKGIFVGVGGSFDVLSGYKKRAPKILRKLNLEWLYRITKEPKRINRFYKNNIKFIIKMKKYKKES